MKTWEKIALVVVVASVAILATSHSAHAFGQGWGLDLLWWIRR